MKKIFYFILAAAAIVASCAKEPISEPVSPSGDGSSVFTGTIIQPGGIDEATKVSIIDQTSEVDKVYIKWTQYDQIHIIKKGSGEEWNSTTESTKPKDFQAASSEATTEFTGYPPTDWIAPGARYAARYYGKNDVWKNYVLACDAVTPGDPVEGITIDCNGNAEAAFLENMPLSCGESTYDSGNFRYNFTFSNAYAILQINVPSKLDFEDLYVCVNAQNVEFESGQLKDGSKYTLCLKNADAVKSTEKYTNKDRVTYFVPVSAGNYNKLTIVAAKDNAEVARMETYVGNVKNTSDSQYALPQLYSNNIYPFDFCNTKTIETANTSDTPCALVSSNGIDFKVNVSADITGDVYITTPAEGKEPANIYLNLRGHKIDGNLYLNGQKSHVEGENGTIVSAEAQTSNSTFVVKPSLTITGLTVKKGSVKVEGKDNKTANVTNITIPAGVTEQIKIDVSGVSSNDENGRVKIVNKSKVETVVVVPETTGDNQKSYVVDKSEGNKDVTEVSKDVVATIGTIGYKTLADAYTAVTEGKTITLVKDIVLKKADALEIKKNNVVLDGQGHTIALDETDPDLAKYLVTSSDKDSRKYGQFHMIDVSGNDVTLKNLTLDSKNYRGASLATTVGGNNVVYENIVYNGKGSAHYYSTNNNGLITFKNCKINTCGYGVHSDTAAEGIVIEGCEIHGWNAFGAAVKNVSLNNSKFYSSEDQYNGTLAAFSIYCPTTFTGCTFSKEFAQAGTYQGIFMAAKSLVSLNECSVEEGELYKMVRTDDEDWAAGSVVAIDATGNATDGFTAGTFVAKQASDIKAAASYEVKPVEGKANVFTIAAGAGVAKIGNTVYETLAEAIAAAQAGDVVSIVKADTYKVPGIDKNITVEGAVDGVVFDCTGSGSVASIPNGATFKKVTMNFGQSSYHGFQHAGHIYMIGCTFNGLFFSYGDMTFTNCTFNQTEKEYNMWCYGKDVTYDGCTFNSVGKFINVYTEDNDGLLYNIVAKDCEFNTSYANKAALNIKETCLVNGNHLNYNVTITNCTCNDLQKTVVTKEDGDLYVGSPIWQVDDRNINAKGIKVTVDDKVVYEAGVGYYIATISALKGFAKSVNAGNTFAGKTVTLDADLDLAGVDWNLANTIASYSSETEFCGTFDGQNHTISNLTCNADDPNYAAAGFFGSTGSCTIKDLTLKNANITSTHYAGAFVGYASTGVNLYNCKLEGGNIISTPELIGQSYDNGDKAGGLVGYAIDNGVIDNCVVDGVTVKAYRDLGGVAGAYEGTIKNCTVKNSTIIQDNTNGYKESVDTYGAILGRNLGATLQNNTATENVTVKTTISQGPAIGGDPSNPIIIG